MERLDLNQGDAWASRVPPKQASSADGRQAQAGFQPAMEAAQAEEAGRGQGEAQPPEAGSAGERQAVAASERERQQARQTELSSHTQRVEVLAGLDQAQFRRIVAAELGQVGLSAAQKAKGMEGTVLQSERERAVEAYRAIARQDNRNLGI